MLFDTHSHLSYEPLDQDEDGIFARLQDAGVTHTMQIGCDIESSTKVISLAKKYPGHYASIGLHPVDAQSTQDEYEIGKNQRELTELLKLHPHLVRAIGETGLDNYHLPDTNIDDAKWAQEFWFRWHMELAQDYCLPLVVHTRDARERTYDLLCEIVEKNFSDIPAIVMHCYSEDFSFAQSLMDVFGQRVYFAFGGILTYRSRNEAIQDAAIRIPISHLLLETDAPFLTPYIARKNGAKHNESSYIGEVLDKLSDLRNEPRDILEKLSITTVSVYFAQKMLTNNTQSEFCIYAQDPRYTRRIDLVLSQMFDGQSRSYIQRLIEDGLVMKNGLVLDRHCKVRRGDVIIVNWKIDKSHIAAEDIPLEVITETDDYALVSKDAGMNVHPVPGEGGKSGTLINALMSHFGSLSVINGIERPGLVHRLDKDTSGILIIAKNDGFMTHIQRQINKRTVKKTYITIVAGRVKETKGYIESYMGRDPNDRKKHTIHNPLNPKLAQTRYKVLGYFGDLASLVEVDLLTGRTHQIRLHMLSIGHPVIGDSVYGNPKVNILFSEKYDLHRQALHAYRVEFTYESERVYGIAPLKQDMRCVIQRLAETFEPAEESEYFYQKEYI